MKINIPAKIFQIVWSAKLSVVLVGCLHGRLHSTDWLIPDYFQLMLSLFIQIAKCLYLNSVSDIVDENSEKKYPYNLSR